MWGVGAVAGWGAGVLWGCVEWNSRSNDKSQLFR